MSSSSHISVTLLLFVYLDISFLFKGLCLHCTPQTPPNLKQDAITMEGMKQPLLLLIRFGLGYISVLLTGLSYPIEGTVCPCIFSCLIGLPPHPQRPIPQDTPRLWPLKKCSVPSKVKFGCIRQLLGISKVSIRDP